MKTANHIEDNVVRQILDQVTFQTSVRVRVQVWNQVGFQPGDQVWRQVGVQVLEETNENS